VAWPPAGYLPYQLAYPQWSFALTNANFTNATITMKSNGVSIAVTKQPYVSGFGENTVVWVPMGLDYTSTTAKMPFNGSDTVYTVTVTNIQYSTVITGFTYTVTLFDPAVPGADYAPPTISGTATPFVGQPNSYNFTSLSNAASYEWRVVRPNPYALNDGAEAGLANFTAVTSAGYAVQDSSVKATGNYSFLLAHPTPPTGQYLTLNQTFVPRTNGSLTVKSRLGYAADGETARIQISADDGSTWQDIYTQSGIGNGLSGPVENSFVTRPFSLSGYQGKSVKLRFGYTFSSGNYVYPQAGFPIGWYLDDITIANAEVWTVLSTNIVATTNFSFTPPQTTNYNLDVRGYIFTEFPLEWGPVKSVTAVAAPLTITMNKPTLNSGQVLLDFTTTGATTFKLTQADQIIGPWTTNLSATLTTNIPGSSYRFATPVGPAARFYRVKSP